MKALLLNSGVGRRMGGLTENLPKCMSEIGAGFTILSRQLAQLSAHGVREIVITTGPFESAIREHVASLNLPVEVTYVPNSLYASTNYIYSMALARDTLEDDVLLMHGDLVVEDSVLYDLLNAKASVMAVDSTLPLPEKDFKARIANGRVIEVGVDLFDADCVACQPAYKWRRAEFALWMDAIQAFCAAGATNVYAENAFNAQNGAIALYPLELNGRLCHEIDTPEDLEAVSAMFLRSLEK